MGNFRAVFSVVRQQEVQVLDVLDDKLQKTIKQGVSDFLGCAVTDVRHVRKPLNLRLRRESIPFGRLHDVSILRKKGKRGEVGFKRMYYE